MIEYSHITKSYGSKTAVDNLNLSIEKELFVLLGPNGAGKTTTLKMTAGIIKPSSGKIFIDGIFLDEEPEKAKMKIAFIPDQPFFYPELTGREFIYFVGRLYGMEKTDIEKKSEYFIERLEVGDWIDMPSKEYSHGMRQRIMFIQALMHNPDIIIIDEPMVGLDPKSGKIIKELLRKEVEK